MNRHNACRPRAGAQSLGLIAAVLALLVFAPAAVASSHQRPFKEVFGAAEQPNLRDVESLAVDPESGDLLAFTKSPQNEWQDLTIEAASDLGGTYKLGFGGAITGWQGEATLSIGQTGTGDIAGADGKGDTVALAGGQAEAVAGSAQITNVRVDSGTFAVGESIEGKFNETVVIPSGTTIVSCSPSCAAPTTITLSQPALKTFERTTLFSGSRVVENVSTETGAFAVGQTFEALAPDGETELAPPGTTITAVDSAEHKLTLSQGVSRDMSGATLHAGSLQVTNVTGSFTAGTAIAGAGIQLGTTIESVAAGTLTLSKPPTTTASGVALTADWHAIGMHTVSGALVEGEELSGSGVQPGTIVTEVDEAAGTFELSRPPTASGPSSNLSADLAVRAPRSEAQQMTTIRESLERLPSVGAGNVRTSPQSGQEKRKLTATKLFQPLEFIGALAERPLELITCDGSDLSGSSPSCSVSEIQRGHRAGIFRYHPDGSPAPFPALGENVIDGRLGYGGKPCAEEASSCDKTPDFGFEESRGSQIAVDPTNGNIYVTVSVPFFVHQQDVIEIDLFSPQGAYLGQITKAGLKTIDKLDGIAVDQSGAIYVSGIFGEATNAIAKFVPHADPPENSDYTTEFPVKFVSEGKEYRGVGELAAGSGPTAGWIFAEASVTNGGVQRILKLNEETGQYSVFVSGYGEPLTVDPSSGNLIATTEGARGQFAEFDGTQESTEAALSRLIVERAGASEANEIVAGSSGQVYVAPIIGGILPANLFVYGPPAPTADVTVAPASEVTGRGARLNGAVNAEGSDVTECFFEWGPTNSGGETTWAHTVACEESIPPDSDEHVVHASISGLTPNGTRYSFRLAAKNENGTERSAVESFTTSGTVTTKSATVTGVSSATLHGLVSPEGSQYTECVFEWGLTTAAYERTEPCQPEAGDIPPDHAEHTVSLPLTGLQQSTTYRFRLKATNGEGTITGSELTFETFGPPQITAVRARDATAEAATIEAEINPSGFDTSYWFEWGANDSYGHVVPVSPEAIGSGQDPIRVGTEIGGLTPGTTYHYRVVAESEGGTTEAPDQIFETLDSCGLPEDRCFELVSRREPGPIAIPGELINNVEMHFQAAPGSAGALAYVAEGGYPDATKGAEVLYRGARGDDGWESTQISAPIVASNQKKGENSNPGTTEWLSNDLSCGFTESWQPLTQDPATRLAIENGGSNLYRINPDNSYTAVTNVAPENPEVANDLSDFTVIAAAQGCGKVIFSTQYRYPGVPGSGLYEWDGGVLRDPGKIPGPTGEVAASVNVKAMSEDGSRVVFTATRQVGVNPGEVGRQGVFVREGGAKTRDVSLSETSTPDTGATYQGATPDGSKVYFTANAGLTEESSPEGTDLYEYDFDRPEGKRLTDLSVDHDIGGAEVSSFLGASQDGSSVFFTAQGQLVPGHGRTLADNQSDGTTSVYRSENGEVSFAFTLAKGEAFEVSADGRYLLFESSGNYTGYVSGGANEAYLYDAKAVVDPLVCVSCRQDGQASVAETGYEVLINRHGINNPLHPSQHLTVREGRAQVFFSSPDSLAPGAVEGQNNVYEWSHGQVFRLTSAQPGQQGPGHNSVGFAMPVGTSADGSNAYFVTPENLTWEDGDERLSVYDARIGGGFPKPPSPPTACEPTVEGSCQGAAVQGPASPSVGTASHAGPGNVKQKKPRKGCPKGNVRKHGKCVKKQGKRRHHKARKHRHSDKGDHGTQERHAHGNRRVGK